MSKNSELDELFLKEYHQYFGIKIQNKIILYVCKLCGGSYSAFDTWTAVRHYKKQHEGVLLKKKHPLKPWKDPDSLFCDTEFLREFVGKEPENGTECGDE